MQIKWELSESSPRLWKVAPWARPVAILRILRKGLCAAPRFERDGALRMITRVVQVPWLHGQHFEKIAGLKCGALVETDLDQAHSLRLGVVDPVETCRKTLKLCFPLSACVHWPCRQIYSACLEFKHEEHTKSMSFPSSSGNSIISAIDLAGNSLLQQLLTAPAGLCQNTNLLVPWEVVVIQLLFSLRGYLVWWLLSMPVS